MASIRQDAPRLSTTGRCHVILVHGTWGAGFWHSVLWDLLAPDRRERVTGWPICDKLQEAGVITHPSFTWSGRNSHHRRMKAGKELAAYIATLELHPSDRLFIVAHSHGGNVALYALRHPGTERVEGITFLATPFMRFGPQDFQFAGLRLLPFAIATTVFAFIVAPLIAVAWSVLVPILKELSFPAIPAISAVLTISFGLAGVIAFLAGRVLRKMLRKTDAALDEIKKLCEYYQPPAPHGRRVLILRKTGDEASMFLESGGFIEWLTRLAWRKLSALSAWPHVAQTALTRFVEQHWWTKWISVLLTIGVAALFYTNRDAVGQAFGLFVLGIVCAAFILFFIQALFLTSILFLNILRFGLGPTLGRTALIRVTSEATPLGLWEVETFPATGFAHSEIHEDSQVAGCIAKWLVKEER